MTYYNWQITHSEAMSQVSRQARILIHQKDSRISSLSEFIEFRQSSRIDRTRAQETLSNQNGFQQSFRAQASLRTPNNQEVLQPSEPRLSLPTLQK
jgi:hypothetical protein